MARPLIKAQGFTLVELMMVVAITGVLAAASYSTYKGLIGKSKALEAQVLLSSMYTAEDIAYSETGTYANCLFYLGHDPGNPIFSGAIKVGFGAGRYVHGFHLSSPIGPDNVYEQTVQCSNCCPRGSYSSVFLPQEFLSGQVVDLDDPATNLELINLLTTTKGDARVEPDGLGFNVVATTYFEAPATPDSLDRWRIDQDKLIEHTDIGY